MSLVSPKTKVVPVSLIRAEPEVEAYPGLDRVGQKLARGFAEFLTGLLALPVAVRSSPIRIAPVSDDGQMVLRHLALAPLDGRVAIAVNRTAVMRLVDLYYGGEGEGDADRDSLSPAEDRFFTRIASALRDLFPAAWLPFVTIAPELEDEAGIMTGKVAVQQLVIALPERDGFEVEFRYPLEMLDAVPGLQSATPADARGSLADHKWQARLMDCALNVPFPLRAVFAEPELPLSTLMSLKPGDLIPICLPSQVDLNIGGLRFARGSAGESNGRAAICIDQF